MIVGGPRWAIFTASLMTAIVLIGPLLRLGETAQDNPGAPDQLLSHGFDCFSCHAINEDVVGPAWSAIAAHYHHDAAKADYLAAKIRAGSVGDFGKVPMPAHPDINPNLALQLAKYILSLKPLNHPMSARQFSYKNQSDKTVTVDFKVFEDASGRKVVTDGIFAGFE